MIAGSAFMHASYSVLLKTRGKDPYLLPGFFLVATLVAWGDVWRQGGLGAVAWGDLPMIYLAALFYVMYQMFCTTAYQMGDISALYPLTVLGPVLIPIWAGLFLSEHIGVQALSGIALTFVGAAVHQAENAFLGRSEEGVGMARRLRRGALSVGSVAGPLGGGDFRQGQRRSI